MKPSRAVCANELPESAANRFWSKVNILGDDDCWEWEGTKFWNTYGQFQINGKTHYAHRVAYLLEHGYIPSNTGVVHSQPYTHSKSCVNPKHLHLVLSGSKR